MLAAPGTGFISAHDTYHVTDNAAPPADDARCEAQANREPAGTPGPSQWHPILTATTHDVDVIAYRTQVGPVFCEVTPSTVTLSAPVRTTTASAVVTFRGALGSVAGVAGHEYRYLYAKARGDSTTKLGAQAVIEGGVFVVPDAMTTQSTVQLTGFTTPQPIGPGKTVGTTELTGATTVTDRTVPPADQSSPGGQVLANCLAHDPTEPIVVPSAWLPGASATLDAHESLQLGSFHGMLAACRITDGTVSLQQLSDAGDVAPSDAVERTSTSCRPSCTTTSGRSRVAEPAAPRSRWPD